MAYGEYGSTEKTLVVVEYRPLYTIIRCVVWGVREMARRSDANSAELSACCVESIVVSFQYTRNTRYTRKQFYRLAKQSQLSMAKLWYIKLLLEHGNLRCKHCHLICQDNNLLNSKQRVPLLIAKHYPSKPHIRSNNYQVPFCG